MNTVHLAQMEGVLRLLFFCFYFFFFGRKKKEFLAYYSRSLRSQWARFIHFSDNFFIYLRTDFVLGTWMNLGSPALNSTDKYSPSSENLHGVGVGVRETNNEQMQKKTGNDSAVLKIRWR